MNTLFHKKTALTIVKTCFYNLEQPAFARKSLITHYQAVRAIRQIQVRHKNRQPDITHFTYRIIIQELTHIVQQQVVPKRNNRGADKTRTRRTTSADQSPASGAKHCQGQESRDGHKNLMAPCAETQTSDSAGIRTEPLDYDKR